MNGLRVNRPAYETHARQARSARLCSSCRVPPAGTVLHAVSVAVTVRAAREGDLAALPVIERAAGEMFRSLGMDTVADGDVPTIEELDRYRQAGGLIVAEDDGRVVGYVLLEVLAGAVHVEQVSVHPDAARRRIGSRLLDAAERWAREQGLTSLTLTSYQDVPWNAPYYAQLGFRVVPGIEQPSELRAVRQAEAARGLDAWPRVVMRRSIAPS